MRAMLMRRIAPLAENPQPLELADLPIPEPGPGQVRLRVAACGVCHTELDEIEGRTPPPHLPVILGHQVVGRVDAAGPGASRLAIGQRAGVAWIFSACGACHACLAGNENLCPNFQATGRDAHGGYAEYMLVSQDFAHPIPEIFTDAQAAPLLCAGAVGYRSLRLGNLRAGQSLGLTGFGASAHLVLMLARALYPASAIFVFSRSAEEREFGLQLGAAWAGDIGEDPPQPLDCMIDTTPVWRPVIEAMRCLSPGGRLVINAIRKESIDQVQLLRLDYSTHLWMEKEIKSVANVSRRDVSEFLQLAARIPIQPEYQEFELEEANQALIELKSRKIRGAKVLKITQTPL